MSARAGLAKRWTPGTLLKYHEVSLALTRPSITIISTCLFICQGASTRW